MVFMGTRPWIWPLWMGLYSGKFRKSHAYNRYRPRDRLMDGMASKGGKSRFKHTSQRLVPAPWLSTTALLWVQAKQEGTHRDI